MNIQLAESSEGDKRSGVDRNSVKLVDESSVVVQNTSLNLEGLDKKAVVDQRVFSLPIRLVNFGRLDVSVT